LAQGADIKGIKFDDTTQQRLAALARIRDRLPHWHRCKAIETILDREENYEREKRDQAELTFKQSMLKAVAEVSDASCTA
jgi:hypothetical protein